MILVGMRVAISVWFLWVVAAGEGLPLVFVPNAGQFDPAVQFVVQTPGVRAAFLSDGPMFLAGESRLRVRFAGADPDVLVEGAGDLTGRANFLTGRDSTAWRTDLPTFGEVAYRELYPGIDARYAGVGRLLKSEFVVQPDGDPDRIRMEYLDASAVWVEGGELRVTLGGLEFREWAPEVYQISSSGSRLAVQAAYRIYEDKSVGFAIGPYDRGRALVIDPVITYSTYLGGSGMGAVTSVARDGLGNLYAAG